MNKKLSVSILIVIVLLNIQPMIYTYSFSENNLDQTFNHLTGIHVALYNSTGAWSYTRGILPKMLDWAGCTYENVSGQDIIEGCLENCDILVWPGGNYVAYWGEMGLEGKEAVQEFVSNGGGYLGICAGVYYACDYIVWMDDYEFPPPDFKVEGDELNLDLIDAVAWGPIFALAERPYPGFAMVQVNINNDHPITRTLPEAMQILYMAGPYIVPNDDTEQEINILGTFDLTGQYAIAATSFGDGRVFLISPHAEIEEDSDRDGYAPYPEYLDVESDWPLLYNALEWLVYRSSEDTGQASNFNPFAGLVVTLVVLGMRTKKIQTKRKR